MQLSPSRNRSAKSICWHRLVHFTNVLCCCQACNARNECETLLSNLTESTRSATLASHCQDSLQRTTQVSKGERSCTPTVSAPVLLQRSREHRRYPTFDSKAYNSSPLEEPSTVNHQDCKPVYIGLFYFTLTLLASTIVAVASILAGLYLFRKVSFKPKFEWEKEFQPWFLVTSAFSSVGRQAAVLLFVYYQICEWNASSHNLMRDCQIHSVGFWVMSCEVTKAFARCFPLLGASISMFAAGRHALQRKMWYELLKRRVLLSLTTYDATKDPMMFFLVFDFFCGACHFLPYAIESPSSILATVLVRWLAPCVVFFVLLERSLCTEKDLVSLPTFFEDNFDDARINMNRMEYKRERILRRAARSMQSKIIHECNLDCIIDLLKAECNTLPPELEDSTWGEHRNMLAKGMWPASVLLNKHLVDDPSQEFWYAWLSFEIAFCLVNACVLAAICTSLSREFFMRFIRECSRQVEILQGLRQHVWIHKQFYMKLGSGYCRGYGMRHLYGHHQPLIEGGPELNEPGGRHCAEHCSDISSCVGFAIDVDSCNIYLDTVMPVPQGWFPHNMQEYYDSVIARTNNDFEVTCWLKHPGNSGHNASCIVYLFHLVSAIVLVLSYLHKRFYGRFELKIPLLLRALCGVHRRRTSEPTRQLRLTSEPTYPHMQWAGGF